MKLIKITKKWPLNCFYLQTNSLNQSHLKFSLLVSSLLISWFFCQNFILDLIASKLNIWCLVCFILIWLGDCQGFSDLTLKRKSNQATRVSNGSSLRVKAALRSTHNKSVVEIPKQWYNLVADLSVKPPPPLHPKTFEPIKPEDLAHLFPNELIKQEATQERFIDIPEEVLEIYKLWRPTPLIRFLIFLFSFLILIVFLCVFFYIYNLAIDDLKIIKRICFCFS